MIDVSSPSGPVKSPPWARADSTRSRTAACSALLREVVFSTLLDRAHARDLLGHRMTFPAS